MFDVTPTLRSGETLIREFVPDRGTYIREHIILAALGSVIVTLFLVASGNPNPWVGPVAAIAAIALRGFYVASEQLNMRWLLTNQRMIGPDGRSIPLAQIDRARGIFSAAQVITNSGDKYMLKYLHDTRKAVEAINSAVIQHRQPAK